MEAILKPYPKWNIQALQNELKFQYIEIARKPKGIADSINKIRAIEAELVERKIRSVASESEIKEANKTKDKPTTLN